MVQDKVYLNKSKAYFWIGLFLFCFQFAFGQNQNKADHLKNLYKTGDYSLTEFRILTKITESETNPDSILAYANILIDKAEAVKPKDSSLEAFKNGYLAKGNALQSKGDNSKAIDAFLKSLDYAENAKDKRSMGYLQISIADTYAAMENKEYAEKYYTKGIAMLRKVKDSINLASALLNAGDWSITHQKYDEALAYFNESSLIFKKLDNPLGRAYNLGNIGIVHAEQNNDLLAENNINEAITILEELDDYYAISIYLTYLADIYADKENFDLAFKYANRSLALAKKNGLKKEISDANLKLSELYEKAGNIELAHRHYKDYIIYRDSVRNIKEVQRIGNAMTSKAQTEAELANQKQKTQNILMWASVGVLFLIGLLAYGLFKRHKFVKATNKIIAAEKQRSDDLLLNILPEDTAKELKDKGRVEAKKYPQVTVLFSDFKGFTKYAENLSPEVLVQTIDHYFSKFDLIMEKYDLEKIKTIGDAYMAAGGLNFDNEKHAEHMVLAAKEMNDFVATAKLDDITDATFDIRIGINTGPVVAGVVGTKKFAYDIWGDTVNIAARMESSSEAGRINISEDTYRLVKDAFDCEYRGKLAVKNRGELNMYFVNS
ncbi:adenylate/guanylate cyclase domain-containing protein [Winogradskyella ouciana]|uniref:adenylate/guanylate cyclase domain-containing protein n=1 Tax=Winogradskyella ouciana TaxID=2608631 RepID=UPI003D27A3A3